MAYLHIWATWLIFTFGLHGLSSPLGCMAYLHFEVHRPIFTFFGGGVYSRQGLPVAPAVLELNM